MRANFFKFNFLCIAFLCSIEFSSGQYIKLLDFADTLGFYPRGSLVNSGDTLFGTLQWGKTGNYNGSIYRIRTDGTAYKIIYDFKGSEGFNPLGAMVLKSNMLYGATYEGGSQYKGNLFKIKTDGNNFESFFSFHDSLGERPVTPLEIRGDTIFGVAAYGGKYNQGVLYRMLTDGSHFTKLKDFSMVPTSVIYFDHYLYGVLTDNYPGRSIIYRIKTDGSDYQVLKESTEGSNAIPIPVSPLIAVDSELYGGACAGNTNSDVFKIKPDGSGYESIHDFGTFSNILPTFALAHWNNYFLGVGSGSNRIFKVSKEGDGKVIYEFSYQEGDYSNGSLLLYNDCLFGTTLTGGKQGQGVIYKYNLISKIPVKQAESIKVTNLTCSQMKISWKRGNGTHGIVFIKAGNRDDFSITNNSQYKADYHFGKGSQLNNSGWFCVYNGKDTSVTITGTEPTVQYQVKVCEYNVALLNDEKYNIQSSSSNPVSVQSPKCEQTIFLDLLPISNYGDPSFNPEGISSSGLKVSYKIDNTSVASILGDQIVIKNPGTANITATQEGNEFYSPAIPVIRQIKIEKALLKVMAVDTSREEGQPNPVFGLKYGGFVNGEKEGVLMKPPIISCGATEDSPSGKYEIVLSGGQDDHYSFKYYNGILMVKLSTGTESFPEGNWRIYPNPADDYLYIEGNDFSGCVIQISDLFGRILINKRLSGHSVDISSLTSGFYLLKTQNLTYKFAKH